MSLAKKLISRVTKFHESFPPAKINEEYPSEIKKLLNSKQLKTLGDLLSKLGFDVQNTDFGSPVPNLSNRDPRLKDKNYVVFILGTLSSRYSTYEQLYVLYNGKIIFGNEQNFHDSSWTSIIKNSKLWVLNKATDIASTTTIKAARKEAQAGAIALDIQKSRAEYEDTLNRYMLDIENAKKNLAQNPDDNWYKDTLKRNEGYLKDLLDKADKSTGKYKSGLDKYRKQLAEIKKNAAAAEFDELAKDDKLLESVQRWLDTKSKEQVDYLKTNLALVTAKKASMPDDMKWFHQNYDESQAMRERARLIDRMMDYLESWMKSGELSADSKKSMLELLSI